MSWSFDNWPAIRLLPLFLVVCTALVFTCSRAQTTNCDRNCNPIRRGFLNVHIICHTHLDTGWVQTYEEYYHQYVRQIYNSMTEHLSRSPQRRFIAVETSFFSKWYNEQNAHNKRIVQGLFERGQLEFTSGAWSMNDEASAYYKDIIDDFTIGHEWLNATFGQCARPRAGWQIDPFGHSREHSSILAQMNFDGLFLGRIDFQDKLERERSKSMEFVWKSSPSLGSKADLFTSVLPNVYWPPNGFCFDVNCYDEPIDQLNADQRANEFIQHAKSQSNSYATRHTIVTMGMDFYFRDAAKWFDNLDLLIGKVNQLGTRERVHLLYSTPECYMKALRDEYGARVGPRTSLSQLNMAPVTRWPVKIDDFFPYADVMNAYWTGYFTSRPSLKLHIKRASNTLTVAKQLSVLAMANPLSTQLRLSALKQAMGIMQHHDAITGTSKQHVTDDYHRMLSTGVLQAEDVIAETLQKLMKRTSARQELPTYIPRLQFCMSLNESRCSVSEDFLTSTPTSRLLVVVYNPIAHELKHYLRVPIGGAYLSAQLSVYSDSTRQFINSQLAPVAHKLAGNRNYIPQELIFKAVLPPLGYSTFAIQNAALLGVADLEAKIAVSSQVKQSGLSKDTMTNAPGFSIGNAQLSVLFDGSTGMISGVQTMDPSSGAVTLSLNVRQNFYTMKSKTRDFSNNKVSGAYRLSPVNEDPRPVTGRTSFKVFRGPEVEEVHQVFNSWITQIVRVYRQLNSIELDWQIGPIPLAPYEPGYEIITRFDSSLNTTSTFFTDSNGRETLRRIKDFRPTFNLFTNERISANYYPVTSWAFIHDHQTNQQLSLLTDRGVGCSSLENGSIELLLHRRLMYDDGYGMDEALNELGEDGAGLVVRGKTQMLVGSIQESVKQMRILSKIINNKPLMGFTRIQEPRGIAFNPSFTGLRKKLPPNIHLLSLEQWSIDTILLRLEHFFEINEDSQYSRSKLIDLKDLFIDFEVIDVQETSLNVVESKQAAEEDRVHYEAQFNPYANFANMFDELQDTKAQSPFTFVIRPMEIKTFLIKVALFN